MMIGQRVDFGRPFFFLPPELRNRGSGIPPEKSRRDLPIFRPAVRRTRIPYIFAPTNDENMCKIQVKDGQFPGIYKITEKNTGKVYIGQTSRSINERLTQHVMTPAKGSAIDEAIQRRGKDEFNFETLAPMKDPSTEQLWFQEYYFIAKHRSYDETYGFNQTKGNRGREFENFEAAFMRDFICVSDKLFKDIMKTYGIDFTGKRVLLINNFDESVKNFLEFQTGKENVDIIYESFDIEDKKELQDALGEYIKEKVMEKKGMKYDVIIANPPYGKIGNEITKAVIDNIDYGVFVNLLPANDYRRWHKEDKLYQYVDINSMKAVQDGFKDAKVTTMMCRVNKHRALYISENEFEIENYIDPQLKKYFYENTRLERIQKYPTLKNCHDSEISLTKFKEVDADRLFLLHNRALDKNHKPAYITNTAYKWNVEKSVDKEYMIQKHTHSGRTISFSSILFNTKQEKDNFAKFFYDNPEFIHKLIHAIQIDSYTQFYKVFPNTDWTKPQTVESILKDYGYTPSEIGEVVDDLANFRGMEE